jgi:hypothetical protein
MAKQKFDGVVEAVRYTPDGLVEWVRAYERRGAVFGDHVLLNRGDLILRLKAGKRFVVGKRIPYMGANFDAGPTIQLVRQNGSEVLCTAGSQASRDHLEGVPVI